MKNDKNIITKKFGFNKRNGGCHELSHELNTWDKNKHANDTKKYGATNNKYYSTIRGKYVGGSEW